MKCIILLTTILYLSVFRYAIFIGTLTEKHGHANKARLDLFMHWSLLQRDKFNREKLSSAVSVHIVPKQTTLNIHLYPTMHKELQHQKQALVLEIHAKYTITKHHC